MMATTDLGNVSGQLLQLGDQFQGLIAGVAAQLSIEVEGQTDLRSPGVSEQLTQVVVVELNTAHTGGFALRHTRYR